MVAAMSIGLLVSTIEGRTLNLLVLREKVSRVL